MPTNDGSHPTAWYHSATRWTQLTLVEDDPIRFDPDQWIDIFKRTKSNAACLSAGGYIAYYPSKVPYHYVSRYLGDSDPFGALVDGARALDMHVMARVDPHAIHQDAADAHPEWIAVDQSGKPRRHWANPDVWVTCAYGSYNLDYLPQIAQEIVRDYDVDAVFANRWQGHGICYCEHCKSAFYTETRYDLPTNTDENDPTWRAWAAWRRARLSDVVVTLDKAVQSVRPKASFIPNMSGASLMEFNTSLIENHCPFLVVDHQGRHGTEPLWMAGRNAKRMRATFPDRPVVLITSVGPEEPVHRWKDSVTTGPEIIGWVADGAAHGMIPWFTKFNGVIPDERWIEPVANAFALHEAIEPTLAETQPVADIAVLDASTTLRHWSREERPLAEADEYGFYQALVEAKLPFEFLSDEALGNGGLDRFKVLILPNAMCLSDSQCSQLRTWVTRGGNLIAAANTALADENGQLRSQCGLADVFGIADHGPPVGPVKNSYIAFAGEHPLNAGFDGASRIIGGTQRLDVVAAPSSQVPIKMIPDFPDLPMEEVYPRAEATAPAAIIRETEAGGRTVYFPWNIGATFWNVLAQDHQRLIENAVRWVLGEEPMIKVIGQSVLDVAVRKGEQVRAVSLVNLTNPMMMKGPIREIYPVGEHSVSVVLPEGVDAVTGELLVAGQPCDVRIDDGRAVVIVPSIETLEVLRLSWIGGVSATGD